MDKQDDDAKQDEVDRMLNDPDAKMEPSLVWTLLAEIAERAQTAKPTL